MSTAKKSSRPRRRKAKSRRHTAMNWPTTGSAFANKLELTNNDFVRTTEPRHKPVVQAILTKLHAEGHFYKAQYEGFYSPKEETFLTDKDRRPDGTFDPS